MKIGIIGEGAIGSYVRDSLLERGHVIRAILKRRERLHGRATDRDGTLYVASVGDLPDDIEHMIDCAGHLALKSYGPDILRRGTDLQSVTYIGRKPPRGWRGSAAETRLDLDNLDAGAEVHFDGTARDAALEYPKNANVAAAVALAGLGFDKTQVKLIADPGISENIHEVQASGDFGRFSFQIRGRSLADNPRSSALAAMSIVSKLEQETQNVRF